MIRLLVLAAPDGEVLARVGARPAPRGVRAVPGRPRLLRETYFDTPDGLLRSRSMELILRQTAGEAGALELVRRESVTLDGTVTAEVLRTPLLGGGVYATLQGPTELASVVRGLVEPAALRPRLARDVDREEWELRAGWMGGSLGRLHVDRILLHRSGHTQARFEVVASTPTGTGPLWQRLSRHLQDVHRLRPESASAVERAEETLGPEPPGRPVPHGAQRVCVVVVRDGRVALVRGPGGWTLPSAPGSGESVAEAAAAAVAGGGIGEAELLGMAPPVPGRDDIEAWLVERPGGSAPGPDAPVWVPLRELLERVGSPGVRDRNLVAALLLLATSASGRRTLETTPGPGPAPTLLPEPEPRPPVHPGDHALDFLDLELGILDFNTRVLELAEDPDVPILERLRFLSIFSSNLDEFFVVRAGRLPRAEDAAAAHADVDEPPPPLRDVVDVRTRALLARQASCLRRMILPELERRGVRLRRWGDLQTHQREELRSRFHTQILPVLTPQALTRSPGQPFPHLESLRLSLAVLLHDARVEGGPPHLACVPLPPGLPRFLAVPDGSDFIALEDVVAANASELFPGRQVGGAFSFRLTRKGDVDVDEDAASSLLVAMEDEVQERPFKPPIRLEVERGTPRDALAYLVRNLRAEAGTVASDFGQADVFEVDTPLDLRALAQLADLEMAGGSYPRFTAVNPWPEHVPIFDLLKARDRLVFHPYDSFDASVTRFLDEAARDPEVVAIKITLYRTGSTSPFGGALLDAIRNGKDVAVFVELKARFDEESNIGWTHRILEAGGHVVYGVVGFKAHAKTALVVRREADGVRRYVHVGTGNYNASTARFYTDLGLLSADPELGADVNDFFNELTGSAGPPVKRYRKLLVAPSSLAQGLETLVEREVAHAREGRPARIIAKVNGLTDRRMIRALYRASEAGVDVDLIVRSACCLRPGVPGLSSRIRVRSILGRFLEHARIYYFENDGEGAYFIASADWRKRNLRKRVEVAVPIEDPEARDRLRAILDAELADPRAWILDAGGTYRRLDGVGVPAQEHFLGVTRSAPAPAAER